jgi:hypothetical protein
MSKLAQKILSLLVLASFAGDCLSAAALPLAQYPSPTPLISQSKLHFENQALVPAVLASLRSLNVSARVRQIKETIYERVVTVPEEEFEQSLDPNFVAQHENASDGEFRVRSIGARLVRISMTLVPTAVWLTQETLSLITFGGFSLMSSTYYQARLERPANLWTHGVWNLVSPIRLTLNKWSHLPELNDKYFPLTQHGVDYFYIGDPAKLAKAAQDRLPSVYGKENKATLGRLHFVKMRAGSQPIWAMRLTVNNISNLAYEMNWKHKESEPYPEISESEVSVTAAGLRPYFVGDPLQLAKTLLARLPPFPKYPNQTHVDIGGVSFRKAMSYHHRVWAFEPTKENLHLLARAMGWQVKKNPDELIEKLGLEEAIALLSNDPLRLKQYIQLVHPELMPEDVDRMVITATTMPGMGAERRDLLEAHKAFRVKIQKPDVLVTRVRKGQRGFWLEGTVEPGVRQVQISGNIQRMVTPDENGYFSIPIPRELKTYFVYAFDDRLKIRSTIATVPVEKLDYYAEKLDPPDIILDAENFQTTAHIVKVDGVVAAGTPFVQVTGAHQRKIQVRPDGRFSTMLAVPKTGEVNLYSFYAVNDDDRTISTVLEISIEQLGKKQDADVVFQNLLASREDILKDIKKGTPRYYFLMSTLEESLLKHFTYGEEKGFAYLAKRIKKERSKPMKELYEEVNATFREVARTRYPLKKGEKLYFFQKYTVYKGQKMLNEPDPITGQETQGVLIANEQGLGKTVTALVLINGDRGLIITPNAVVSTWAEQEDKFILEPRIELLEGSYLERERTLKTSDRPQVVTNTEFTQGMTQRRADALSARAETLVIDEADYLGRIGSQQSKGTRLIRAKRRVLLTATPFKKISHIGNLLNSIFPDDPQFSSPRAFARAFPADDPDALKALFLLLHRHMIRVRKADVFEEYDPKIPLSKQSDRLPKKNEIPTEKIGQFTLLKEQADSIRLLLTDYQEWCRIHRGQIKDHKVTATREDRKFQKFKEGFFPKLQALRQIMDDPAYIGLKLVSPKHKKMDQIVEKELENPDLPDAKVLIFCKYIWQVEAYLKRYQKFGAVGYYGELAANKDGYKIDKDKQIEYYVVDEYEKHVLKDGRPIRTTRKAGGRPIRALDYQRILFQNDPNVRVMVATYESGSVGVTLTGAHAVIYDDLASTYRDQYQAGDRAHRIDNSRKKLEVRYYWLQALYPEGFLKSLPYKIFDKYFSMGTYDQVQHENIQNQGRIFHRIMDLIGGEEELKMIRRQFLGSRMPFLFEKSQEREENAKSERNRRPGKKTSRLSFWTSVAGLGMVVGNSHVMTLGVAVLLGYLLIEIGWRIYQNRKAASAFARKERGRARTGVVVSSALGLLLLLTTTLPHLLFDTREEQTPTARDLQTIQGMVGEVNVAQLDELKKTAEERGDKLIVALARLQKNKVVPKWERVGRTRPPGWEHALKTYEDAIQLKRSRNPRPITGRLQPDEKELALQLEALQREIDREWGELQEISSLVEDARPTWTEEGAGTAKAARDKAYAELEAYRKQEIDQEQSLYYSSLQRMFDWIEIDLVKIDPDFRAHKNRRDSLRTVIPRYGEPDQMALLLAAQAEGLPAGLSLTRVKDELTKRLYVEEGIIGTAIKAELKIRTGGVDLSGPKTNRYLAGDTSRYDEPVESETPVEVVDAKPKAFMMLGLGTLATSWISPEPNPWLMGIGLLSILALPIMMIWQHRSINRRFSSGNPVHSHLRNLASAA